MVGVAGKSRACNNCKRRRVKCGFERPACLRCTKVRVQCDGYTQQTIFVNRTLKNPTVSATSVLAKDCRSRLRDLDSCTLQPNSSMLDELLGLEALAKPPIASPCALRYKAFQLIQKLYLPQPQVTDDSFPSHVDPTSWFGAVCELEDPCPVLDHSLIAFCTIQLHIANILPISREQGVEKYNVALEYLSFTLSRGENTKLEYILASIVVLSTCELFCFPTDNGLQVHIRGIADILCARKDLTDIPSDTWNRLWSRLRVISTLSQLAGGQRCSVSDEKWARFMPEKPTSDSIDQLMDLIHGLPKLFESISEKHPGKLFEHADLTRSVSALWDIMRDIYAWQTILYTTSSKPVYIALPSKLYNPCDEAYDAKLFPFSLEFSSLQTATQLVVSWAFQLHVYIVLQRVLRVFGESAVLLPEFIDPHNCYGSIQTEGSKLARLLCQSIEYCHRLQMGTFGPQTMIYPFWVVRQFFAQSGAERESRWCEQLRNMRGEGTRFSIRLMAFQGSIKLR